MIQSIEQLKKERPDLVEEFESMTREQLIEQCYKEALDAINMESRVALFMEECTISMSKTNYTLESLRSMINEKKEHDINEFCYYETCDNQTDLEVGAEIKQRAKMYDSK